MDEIQQFLQDYDVAVMVCDIARIANHFHNEFILSTPTKVWHLNNNDEFKVNLAKSFNKYSELGAKACKMLATEIINLKSNHCLVNVKWGLLNAENMTFFDFIISYCMKRIDDSWKFIFVIDHNEPS